MHLVVSSPEPASVEGAIVDRWFSGDFIWILIWFDSGVNFLLHGSFVLYCVYLYFLSLTGFPSPSPITNKRLR